MTGLVGVAFFALVSEDALSRETGRFICQRTILVDRIRDARVDAALDQGPGAGRPKFKIFPAMARSRMNKTRPDFLSDMVA